MAPKLPHLYFSFSYLKLSFSWFFSTGVCFAHYLMFWFYWFYWFSFNLHQYLNFPMFVYTIMGLNFPALFILARLMASLCGSLDNYIILNSLKCLFILSYHYILSIFHLFYTLSHYFVLASSTYRRLVSVTVVDPRDGECC